MHYIRWVATGCHSLALSCALAIAGSAHAADNWPAKPVRIVNPYTAGGGVDVVGRAIANQLSDMWGQPVVTDNRPGAGTNSADSENQCRHQPYFAKARGA